MADQSTRKLKNFNLIVRSATALFIDQGVEPVSVNQIIEAAGVSRRTFYAHFKNKNELHAAIISPFFHVASARLRKLDDDQLPILPAILDVYLSLWESHPDALVLTQNIPKETYQIVQRDHDQFIGQLSELFQHAYRNGELKQADPVLSLALFGRVAVSFLILFHRSGQPSTSYRQCLLDMLYIDSTD